MTTQALSPQAASRRGIQRFTLASFIVAASALTPVAQASAAASPWLVRAGISQIAPQSDNGNLSVGKATVDNSVGLDARHVDIDSKARVDGQSIGTIHIDPTVYSLNLGYRF